MIVKTSTIAIKPVTTRAQLREWIRFPRLHVYGAQSPWVPPLDRDVARMVNQMRNPYFRHASGALLLAQAPGGQIVGRILAHVNRLANERHHERVVSFGFFEAKDCADGARALIDAVRAFGARRGCDVVRGPFNLTVSQEMGVLMEGFEHAPTVDLTYTAPYYPRLLEEAGLRPVFPMATSRTDTLDRLDPDQLLGPRQRDLMRSGRLVIRGANPQRFDDELELMRELANDAFAESPYFVPISREEFTYQIEPYRRAIDPALSLFAFLDGRPVGFATATPDFAPLMKPLRGTLGLASTLRFLIQRSALRGAVGTFMGVRRAYQGHGIMRALQAELVRALRQRNYRSLTVTWMSDENSEALGVAQFLGARPLHRLTLFEGAVQGE